MINNPESEPVKQEKPRHLAINQPSQSNSKIKSAIVRNQIMKILNSFNYRYLIHVWYFFSVYAQNYHKASTWKNSVILDRMKQVTSTNNIQML